MAKQKTAAEKAAERVNAPEQKEQVEVIQTKTLKEVAKVPALQSGLDPNHQVDLLTGLDRHFMQPNAAEKNGVPEEAVKKINAITAIGYVAVMTSEIMFGKSDFAQKMRLSQLNAIKEVAPMLGVQIDVKSLPAPDKNGMVTVNSNAVTISKETKEAIKKEHDAKSEKVELDPTKFTSIKDFAKAANHVLSLGGERPYDKIVRVIALYQAYLIIQANKLDDEEKKMAEIKKINAISRADLLQEITEIVGNCPFSVNGIAKYMRVTTESSKSPISAFCSFRRASLVKKTGATQIEDSLVADIVKVLILWSISSEIKTREESIKSHNANIKTLKKNEKANEKAIAKEKENIEKCEKEIAALNDSKNFVLNPSEDAVVSIAGLFTSDTEKPNKTAMRIFTSIWDCYYPNVDYTTVDPEIREYNAQQYAGVITDLFRNPLDQLVGYSLSGVKELEFLKPEEPEKESKNS